MAFRLTTARLIRGTLLSAMLSAPCGWPEVMAQASPSSVQAMPGPRPVVPPKSGCLNPSYPAWAVKAGLTGTTSVVFAVDAQGRTSNVRVTQSSGSSPAHQRLDAVAVATILRCQFDPAPGFAPGLATQTYKWQIEDNGTAPAFREPVPEFPTLLEN